MPSFITFTNEALVIKYNSYNNTFHPELSPPILLRMCSFLADMLFPVLLRVCSIVTYLLYIPCPTAHVRHCSRPACYSLSYCTCADLLFPVLLRMCSIAICHEAGSHVFYPSDPNCSHYWGHGHIHHQLGRRVVSRGSFIIFRKL
jgi:hypothetical protein